MSISERAGGSPQRSTQNKEGQFLPAMNGRGILAAPSVKGGPNIGPVENLVSERYTFFAIEGAPNDPGRRVLLAHAYEAYAGLRQDPRT